MNGSGSMLKLSRLACQPDLNSYLNVSVVSTWLGTDDMPNLMVIPTQLHHRSWTVKQTMMVAPAYCSSPLHVLTLYLDPTTSIGLLFNLNAYPAYQLDYLSQFVGLGLVSIRPQGLH
ncbi:hypothetical protein L484_002536 [Morus notabilis]|uniref:Uncharacterized protein n=1 Tax=Morus notabilis TaxID=981085 RepID=W9RH85_9ROSA|nr:hypothetical protein L484_002536 [Morus notabilis]